MPTLSELAKTQQTTTTPSAQGGAVARPASATIETAKTIDRSAGLAQDIGKMFGGILEQHQDASEYAGKRVGTDNLVEYKRGMNEIANLYAGKEKVTSSDMVEKSRLEQGLYETHMQKGTFSDNKLANQAFKDTYAVPATDNLFANKIQNNENRVALFKDETKTDVSFAIGYLGSDIHPENIATFKQQYVDAGLNPNEVDRLTLTSLDNSIVTEVRNNPSSYYDDAGNINQEKLDALVGATYKPYSQSENEGIVGAISESSERVNNHIETEANRQSQVYMNEATSIAKSMLWTGEPYTDENGVTYHFAQAYKNFEEKINADFPLLTKENHTQIMNMYRTAKDGSSGVASALVSDWMHRVKTFIEEPQNATSNPDNTKFVSLSREGEYLTLTEGLTPSQRQSVKNKLDSYTRRQTNLNTVQNTFRIFTKEDLRVTMKNGIKNEDGSIIKPDDVRKVAETNILQTTQFMKETDVSAEGGTQTYTKEMKYLEKLQWSLDGNQPKLYADNNTILKNGVNIDQMSENDIKQLATYVDYQLARGKTKEFIQYKTQLQSAMQILSKGDTPVEEGGISKDQSVLAAKTVLKDAGTNNWIQRQGTDVRKRFNDSVIKIFDEGGEWFTAFNTPTSDGTTDNLMATYNGALDEESILSFVESHDSADFGETFGSDKIRVVVPANINKVDFKTMVNKMVTNAQKENPEIGYNDLSFIPNNNGTDLTYELKANVKGQLKSLGFINKRNTDIKGN